MSNYICNVIEEGYNKNRPTLKFHIDEVVNPDGTEGEQHWLQAPPGVSVLPYDRERNIFLANEVGYAANETSLRLAGGMPELNESGEETGRREVEEELGLIVPTLLPLGVFHSLPNRIDHTTTVFTGEVTGNKPQKLDETEHIERVRLPLTDAVKLVDEGEITDPITSTALYKLNRRLSV